MKGRGPPLVKSSVRRWRCEEWRFHVNNLIWNTQHYFLYEKGWKLPFGSARSSVFLACTVLFSDELLIVTDIGEDYTTQKLDCVYILFISPMENGLYRLKVSMNASRFCLFCSFLFLKIDFYLVGCKLNLRLDWEFLIRWSTALF